MAAGNVVHILLVKLRVPNDTPSLDKFNNAVNSITVSKPITEFIGVKDSGAPVENQGYIYVIQATFTDIATLNSFKDIITYKDALADLNKASSVPCISLALEIPGTNVNL